jgi:hypothetical protein
MYVRIVLCFLVLISCYSSVDAASGITDDEIRWVIEKFYPSIAKLGCVEEDMVNQVNEVRKILKHAISHAKGNPKSSGKAIIKYILGNVERLFEYVRDTNQNFKLIGKRMYFRWRLLLDKDIKKLLFIHRFIKLIEFHQIYQADFILDTHDVSDRDSFIGSHAIIDQIIVLSRITYPNLPAHSRSIIVRAVFDIIRMESGLIRDERLFSTALKIFERVQRLQALGIANDLQSSESYREFLLESATARESLLDDQYSSLLGVNSTLMFHLMDKYATLLHYLHAGLEVLPDSLVVLGTLITQAKKPSTMTIENFCTKSLSS